MPSRSRSHHHVRSTRAGRIGPEGVLPCSGPRHRTLWIGGRCTPFLHRPALADCRPQRVGNAVLRVMASDGDGAPRAHNGESYGVGSTRCEQAGLVEDRKRGSRTGVRRSVISTPGAHTPRIAIQAVPVSAGWTTFLSRFTTGRHYRLLVYADSLDDIPGASPARPDPAWGAVRPSICERGFSRFSPSPESKGVMTCSKTCDGWGATWRWSSMSTAAPEVSSPSRIFFARWSGVKRRASRTRLTSDPPRSEPDGPSGGWVDAPPRIRGDVGEQIEDPAREEVTTLGGLIMTKLDRCPTCPTKFGLKAAPTRGAPRGRRVGVARSFRQNRHSPPDGWALPECGVRYFFLSDHVRLGKRGGRAGPGTGGHALVASFPISSRRAEARR